MSEPRWKLTIQRLFITDILRLKHGLPPKWKPEVRLYRWLWQARWAAWRILPMPIFGPFIITRSWIEPVTYGDNVVPFRRTG